MKKVNLRLKHIDVVMEESQRLDGSRFIVLRCKAGKQCRKCELAFEMPKEFWSASVEQYAGQLSLLCNYHGKVAAQVANSGLPSGPTSPASRVLKKGDK